MLVAVAIVALLIAGISVVAAFQRQQQLESVDRPPAVTAGPG